MSGRADILALATTLGLPTVDAVLLDRYYDEAVLALAETEVRLQATLVAVTAGQATYDLVPLIGGHVRVVGAAFGTRELTRTTLAHLTTFDADYRTTQGTPRLYAQEHEGAKVIRLYPVPDATSAGAVLAPDPFGTDYPTDQLVVWSADRDETAPPWLDLPLALAILAREFTHSSAYRDPTLAAACARLGAAARALGGMP